MQAVHRKNPLHRSYFRHDPKDQAKAEFKCTYSDETHRHKLAKEILQRIKQIKVPSVSKYPPKGMDGPPMQISRPRVIQAHEVRNEMYFFETNAGTVQWSKELPESAHLLIRPDVTFFDHKGQPILLIELEATHKVSEEKKAKLRHLGIDAVEVLLPTGPFEEIEEAFKTTERTKWLYNVQEHNTKYVFVSDRSAAEVPPLDELQRGVFDETFTCRKFMVSDLMRTIGRCLESEPYRSAEANLRSELSRVEKNTERAKLQLQHVQAEHRAGVESQYEDALAELTKAESGLRDEEAELD